MNTTTRAWDGSASRWTDAKSFCKSCLIDETPKGEEPTKSTCSLPVYEPDGTLNVNAVHAAASSLAGGRGGVRASANAKKKAARKLISLYNQLKEDVPNSIKLIAQ